MKKLYLFLFLILFGCQSIVGESRFSPAVTNVKLTKVGVFAPNDIRTEKNVVRAINNIGGNAISLKNVLHFVSESNSLESVIKQSGVSHVLIVTGMIGDENIRYAGTMTNQSMNTNVNLWSTNYATANTTASGYSTPIYTSNNYANVSGKLYQPDGELLWVTDVELKARGTRYTGADAMSEGVADGLVEEMKKSGLLKIK